MANVYAEAADIKKAKDSLFWSRVQWVGALVVAGFALIFGAAKWGFAKLEKGCQTYADSLNEKSEANNQESQQILRDSKENWKREARNVDSDSISVTSSEDGEVVDLVV